MITPKKRARLLAGAAMAVPALILLLPIGDHPALDIHAYYGPHMEVALRNLRETGELPAWNPYQYAGTPYLGNGQANFHYPPNWLFLLMRPVTAFILLILLHTLLASWGMYRLVRHYRLPRPAGILAALSFSFSFAVMNRAYAGHPTILITICQAPALLWLVLRACDRPAPLRLAALAGATAVVLISGHPQFIYYLAMLCGAAALWRVTARLRAKQSWAPAAAAVTGAALIGVTLAAVHLAPMLEVSAYDARGRVPGRELEPGVVPPHEAALPGDLTSLVCWMAPRTIGATDIPGYIAHEKLAYAGFIALALAFAACRSPHRGPVLFLAITAVVAMLASLARHLPLHDLLSLLPRYGSFRVPARILWIPQLCIPALAAFGATALHAALEKGPRKALTVITALFLLSDIVIAVVPKATSRADPPPAAWYSEHIGSERADYRLLDTTRVEAEPIAEGFRLLRGCGYPAPVHFVHLYASAWDGYLGTDPNSVTWGVRIRDVEVLRGLNIRWYVTAERLHPDWKELARKGDVALYEDPQARPLVTLLHGKESVDFSRVGTDRIEATVTAEADDQLVAAETWMPGWRATVDDAPVALPHGPLLHLKLPAGTHRVVFEYDPPARRVGLLFSVAGLLALAGLLVAAWKQRT